MAAAGGLARWTTWGRPFLTDSGGYQVFSFARRGKASIDDQGVRFRDDLAGDLLNIGPQQSMTIQRQLGADIVMVFDECPAATAPRPVIERAVDRTSRWAAESLAVPLQAHQSAFVIVQGGREPDLRQRSLQALVALDAPGYALGGVSVGESRQDVDRVVLDWAGELPAQKPRYVMGVGTPRDLLVGIAAGVDLFDCVLPTRLSRHGSFYDANGQVISITRSRYASDHDLPLVPGCGCAVCARFSRAYLRHLFMRKEITVFAYLAEHNLYSLLALTRRLRQAIIAGEFASLARQLATDWELALLNQWLSTKPT